VAYLRLRLPKKRAFPAVVRRNSDADARNRPERQQIVGLWVSHRETVNREIVDPTCPGSRTERNSRVESGLTGAICWRPWADRDHFGVEAQKGGPNAKRWGDLNLVPRSLQLALTDISDVQLPNGVLLVEASELKLVDLQKTE